MTMVMLICAFLAAHLASLFAMYAWATYRARRQALEEIQTLMGRWFLDEFQDPGFREAILRLGKRMKFTDGLPLRFEHLPDTGSQSEPVCPECGSPDWKPVFGNADLRSCLACGLVVPQVHS